METFQLIGYVGAFAIGLIMGSTGSGGSAMAVPIFNYLFVMDMHSATAHSLFVVGMSASAGVLLNARKQSLDWQLALFFSIPMVVTVFLVRKFLFPSIPPVLYHINDELNITRDLAIMVFFSALMAIAALRTIKDAKKKSPKPVNSKQHYFHILLFGLGIGIITGITGTGGGFLIVPVLILFLRLPIKRAIATSLIIIALKSFIGFIGDLGSIEINWILLLSFTAISLTGMAIGIHTSHLIDEKSLKKGFGYVVLCISMFVICMELAPFI